MISIFLAPGFEEIEALTPLDVLRRCSLDVRLVGISGQRIVRGAHGTGIEADLLFQEADFAADDALLLPGGMPGAQHLLDHAALREVLLRHHRRGGLLCAICAAPMVLGEAGLLEGKRATCYPGFESHLHGADCTGRLVEEDGHVITGRGPGAAMEFAFAVASRFVPASVVAELRHGMIID